MSVHSDMIPYQETIATRLLRFRSQRRTKGIFPYQPEVTLEVKLDDRYKIGSIMWRKTMWKATLPFVLSLVWSLGLAAQAAYLPPQGDEIRYDEYGIFHRPAAPDAISYEKLKADVLKLQHEGKAEDIDGLLSFFSKTPEYRALFKNFTLMYDSQSAQADQVDPQHPRFLVYQDRLIMGFTEQGNSLEIFDLPIGSKEFAAHRIDLGEHSPEKRFVDNPTSCKSCHGTALRPIWGN